MDSSPTLAEFFASWELFRDPVLAGMIVGATLGYLGVYIVLRRMVFASSAIAQAAALGVALSFWLPAVIDPLGHAAGHAAGPGGHVIPSPLFQPVLWAVAASLLATLVFIANPTRLRNRCGITGRPRGTFRKFGLARSKIRELAFKGDIPGVVKGSW